MIVGGRPDNRVLLPLHDRPPAPPVADGRIEHLTGVTMGTTWTVSVVVADGAAGLDLQGTDEATQASQIALFSHWEPTSELSQFNDAAPGRIAVSDPLWRVVSAALDLADQTDGAMDPTLGTVVDLWGFGPPGPRPAGSPLPGAEDIDRTLALSGWTKLRPDADHRSFVQPGGMRLDLSGIAKGHAVDQVSDRLTELGLDHHLVEIGGEMRGRGIKPDGMPWWAEIEAVADGQGRTLVALQDLALATSGDAERGFEVAGRRYSHTLDGRSGRPIDNGVVSVSILADTAIQADALATGLSVLGPRDGMAFAEAHGIAALMTTRADGRATEHVSSAARAMLEEGA